MKVFVSTPLTQGHRASDFNLTEPGELLVFPAICVICIKDENPDGVCGCGRSMVGMISHKGTTTFRVEDRDLTEKQFVNLYLASMQDAGLLRKGDEKTFRFDAKLLLDLADGFNVGDILEKRKDVIQRRMVELSQVLR